MLATEPALDIGDGGNGPSGGDAMAKEEGGRAGSVDGGNGAST